MCLLCANLALNLVYFLHRCLPILVLETSAFLPSNNIRAYWLKKTPSLIRYHGFWVINTRYTHNKIYLIQLLWFTHCRLEMERTNILPMLLKEGHQEVHCQVNILHQFIRAHCHMPNADRKTQHLLKKNVGNNSKYWQLLTTSPKRNQL